MFIITGILLIDTGSHCCCDNISSIACAYSTAYYIVLLCVLLCVRCKFELVSLFNSTNGTDKKLLFTTALQFCLNLKLLIKKENHAHLYVFLCVCFYVSMCVCDYVYA